MYTFFSGLVFSKTILKLIHSIVCILSIAEQYHYNDITQFIYSLFFWLRLIIFNDSIYLFYRFFSYNCFIILGYSIYYLITSIFKWQYTTYV